MALQRTYAAKSYCNQLQFSRLTEAMQIGPEGLQVEDKRLLLPFWC